MPVTGNSVPPDRPSDRDAILSDPKKRTPKSARSLVRPVFFNCVTLIVIFTLCLYGLGLVGVYLRWFILEAPLPNTPTPLVVTVIMPADPGTVKPIIITVVITRQVEGRFPTRTLEPTPTQSWSTGVGAGLPIEPGSNLLATPAPSSTVLYGAPLSSWTPETSFGAVGPTPTHTARPFPTQTPRPTPPPTQPPTATASPLPTVSPATNTPIPTQAPTATALPSPTATVLPSDTPTIAATSTPILGRPTVSPLDTPLYLIPPQVD